MSRIAHFAMYALSNPAGLCMLGLGDAHGQIVEFGVVCKKLGDAGAGSRVK